MPKNEGAPEAHLTAVKEYKQWMGEIGDALKREKTYRKLGRACVDLYEAKKPEEVPFSILYSNTETLIPALYNAKPIPIVTRRFRDEDPMGKAIAETSTRTLKFLLDANSADYDTFDELMQSAVLDTAVVNRGLTRFKYVGDAGGHECVYGEAVRWDKVLHGYARTWKKVPWLCYEWDMSKEEMQGNFKNVPWEAKAFAEGAEEGDENTGETKEELTGVKTFKVYEVWDKTTRKVVFLSPCYPKGLLRKVDDPFGLVGFFPSPKPLNFMKKITTLVPTPLYEHYKSQANELNEITRRLKSIIRSIKYRGIYNSSVDGIEKLLEAEDNTMLPVENVAVMGENAKMDSLLWTVPVQELAQTAQQLYQQREGIKQVIYEITGVSDILRGASVASETATAQNIKNQWGTLRLKKMQKEVQRYCRDALEIMLEIAATKFDVTTIKAMTGLPFMTKEEKQQLEMMGQQAAAAAQAQGQPAPEVPAEVQMLMKLPTWEDIQATLSNDIVREYKTDIETNSTIDAEAAQDKQDISELLNAISQFLNGIGPLMEKGIMPFDIAKAMLLTIARRYNFGSQLEDSLNSMTAPKPQEDPNAGAEVAMKKAEFEAKTQEMQQKAEMAKMEFENEKALMQLRMQLEEQKLMIAKQELEMQQQAISMKIQQAAAQHQQRMEQMAAKAAMPTKEPSNASV